MKKLLAALVFSLFCIGAAQSFDSGFDWNWWNCEGVAGYIAVEDIGVSFTSGYRFDYEVVMSAEIVSAEDAVRKAVQFLGPGNFTYQFSFSLRLDGTFDVIRVRGSRTFLAYTDVNANLLCGIHMIPREPFIEPRNRG